MKKFNFKGLDYFILGKRCIRCNPPAENAVPKFDYSDEKILDGKVVLVTGGTSGVGYAVGKCFIAKGATVILCGRRNISDSLNHEMPKAFYMQIDMMKLESIRNCLEQCKTQFGKLDIVINCAGITGIHNHPQMILGETSIESLKAVMDTNVKAPLFLIKYLKEQDLGTQIFISILSNTSYRCGDNTYRVSKRALMQGLLYGQNNVALNIIGIAPGCIKTPMTWKGGPINHLPAANGRIAYPEEIADLALRLSTLPTVITRGKVFTIDGGELLI